MTRQQLQHGTGNLWQQLTKTADGVSEPARRRARVLAVISLIVLGTVALFVPLMFVMVSGAQLGLYLALLGGTLSLCGLAFVLNRRGQYTAAAGLLVACIIPGPWFAIFSNLGALDTNIISVIYVIPSIILCSFLLPARVTIVLGGLQLAVLFSFSLLGYVTVASAWIALLSLIAFITVLASVSGLISRQDLEQIDRQTILLQATHAQLRELAIRDALTGLYNRRYLEETLEHELPRATEAQQQMGIIMVDVDYFKRFNDAHGHAAGDALLRQISASLQAHIRKADIACRYGGDELTIILPNTSGEVTRQRAEALREGAKNILLEYEHRYLEPITISLGVAVFPDDGTTADAVLKAADDALYAAKQGGRNRVSVANFNPPDNTATASPAPLPSPPPIALKQPAQIKPHLRTLPGMI